MLNHFAAPRLATLSNFFKTSTDRDLLGCYAWNQAVASGLFPLIGDFEVAFRNAVHVALSRHYGGVDSYNWMLPRPNPALAASPSAPPTLPSHHRMSPQTRASMVDLRSQIQSKKGSAYTVTQDDIVAGLHFGFWDQLIKALSHGSHPAGLHGAILSTVFPHAPDLATNPHGSAAFQKRVLDLLKRIRDVRNRVGHHDAIWTTPEFDEFGTLGFVPRRPRHTVASLEKFCSRLCWLAAWIDPSIGVHIKSTDHWWSVHALLSRHALVTYRNLGGEIGTYQAVLETSPAPRSKHRLSRTAPVAKHSARHLAMQLHF